MSEAATPKHIIPDHSRDLPLVRPKILVVPSATIFSVVSLADYWKRFGEARSIQAVALPLVEASGIYYRYSIDGSTREGKTVTEEAATGPREIGLKEMCTFFVEKGVDIYFTIETSLPDFSFTSGASDLVNPAGSSSAQCCINNNITQSYVQNLIEQSHRSLSDVCGDSIKGVAIFCVDLWPMSVNTGRFLLNCFCTQCTQSLVKFKPDFDIQWFRDFPNAANLALVESVKEVEEIGDVGGIAHVDDLEYDLDIKSILNACSRLKGTHAANSYDAGHWDLDKRKFKVWAEQLKTYLQAKSMLTIDAIGRLFSFAATVYGDLKKVIVNEYRGYNWNSGIFNSQMNGQLADEVWIPITTKRTPCDVLVRPTLATRGMYAVLAFFDMVNMVQNPRSRARIIGDLDIKRVDYLLISRGEAALGELPVDESSDPVLPDHMASQPDGVFVGLDRQIVESLRTSASDQLHAMLS